MEHINFFYRSLFYSSRAFNLAVNELYTLKIPAGPCVINSTKFVEISIFHHPWGRKRYYGNVLEFSMLKLGSIKFLRSSSRKLIHEFFYFRFFSFKITYIFFRFFGLLSDFWPAFEVTKIKLGILHQNMIA